MNNILALTIAPGQVIRGDQVLASAGEAIAHWGKRPLIIGGDRSLAVTIPRLKPVLTKQQLAWTSISYAPDCSEASLNKLRQISTEHQADLIIGVGGGKALDTAKLIAHQCKLPIVT
ncbi:MAG: iron-containing alcohol dehydrogenase, partial [Microcoleaceae cyanobacterium]